MAVHQYIRQLGQAVSSSNGAQLAPLFVKYSLRKKRPPQSLVGLDSAIEKFSNIDDYCHGQVQSPYDEILAHHFKGLTAVYRSNFIDAYTHQANLSQSLLKQLQSETTNWLLPVVHVVNIDLRLIAKKADEQLRQRGQKENKLEDVARIMNSYFAVCIRDGVERTSKKWGTLHVINNLFRIYFMLNTSKLCKSLIRPVEAPAFPKMEQFPVAQVVTYKYFVGRLHMFDGKLKLAEADLSLAFQRCTNKSIKNKKSILNYLIPVKILLGHTPSQALLKKFDLTQFEDIVRAVKTGNIVLFNDTLDKYQQFFTQKGIFLILEKAKMLIYRTLFKKLWLLSGKQTKLGLAKFVKVFESIGISIDIDEMECILANLIYQGYMKGYISHQLRVIVLSAKQAFPSLSSVLNE